MAHAAFNWQDPFLLDSQLSDDERMVRDAAAAYCQDKLQPRVVQAFTCTNSACSCAALACECSNTSQ